MIDKDKITIRAPFDKSIPEIEKILNNKIKWILKHRKNMNIVHKEQVIIDNIIEELEKKRNIAIHKKKQAILKDEVWMYRRRRYY